MRTIRWLTFALYLMPGLALAIVIRADVADSKYLVPQSVFPALVDLPGEGHGALIAPRWIVTAAHATQGYSLSMVQINGKWRDVAHVYTYPGFKDEYTSFKKAAQNPTLKDWPRLRSKLEAMHDIALIELTKPVNDVEPVSLYRGLDEQGKIAKIIGKGATGNGTVGQYPNSSHRGDLRRAYNRITRAHAQWIDYRFNCGSKALPLEGVLGNGDSGGPVLIKSRGTWMLAGLADWKHWPEGRAEFVAGVCGQVFSNSRISYYAKWIDHVIAAHSSYGEDCLDAGNTSTDTLQPKTSDAGGG